MSSLPCKDCASGSLHEGTPLGREDTVHGVESYIAEPPDGALLAGIIVLIPDAFGWKLPNTRLLADTYARRGNYRVYIPEFMNGNYLDSSMLNNIKILSGPSSIFQKISLGIRTASAFAYFFFLNRTSVAQPRITAFMSSMRTHEASALPLGAAGFCWGGKYVTLLCHSSPSSSDDQDHTPLIDAGFAAHPGGLSVPTDFEEVKLPLSISIGDQDMALPISGVRQIEEVWGRRPQGRQELVVVEGAKHGFAIRGDHASEEESRQEMIAQDQAVAWFAKWLRLPEKS